MKTQNNLVVVVIVVSCLGFKFINHTLLSLDLFHASSHSSLTSWLHSSCKERTKVTQVREWDNSEKNCNNNNKWKKQQQEDNRQDCREGHDGKKTSNESKGSFFTENIRHTPGMDCDEEFLRTMTSFSTSETSIQISRKRRTIDLETCSWRETSVERYTLAWIKVNLVIWPTSLEDRKKKTSNPICSIVMHRLWVSN